jgi:hypothetical protein
MLYKFANSELEEKARYKSLSKTKCIKFVNINILEDERFSMGNKGGRSITLKTLPPLCADCLKTLGRLGIVNAYTNTV